jgi:hypothetical protein
MPFCLYAGYLLNQPDLGFGFISFLSFQLSEAQGGVLLKHLSAS